VRASKKEKHAGTQFSHPAGALFLTRHPIQGDKAANKVEAALQDANKKVQ